MVGSNYLPHNNHLSRLSRILNYQLTLGLLVVGYLLLFFSLGVFIIIVIFTLASILFSPYLLFVLIREHKIGWIYFFIIIVVVPILATFILYYFNENLSHLLFLPLLLFYFYCFLLRFSVNEWIKEIREHNIYRIQKQKREEELNNYLNNFK
jgi:hypothetical protein